MWVCDDGLKDRFCLIIFLMLSNKQVKQLHELWHLVRRDVWCVDHVRILNLEICGRFKMKTCMKRWKFFYPSSGTLYLGLCSKRKEINVDFGC